MSPEARAFFTRFPFAVFADDTEVHWFHDAVTLNDSVYVVVDRPEAGGVSTEPASEYIDYDCLFFELRDEAEAYAAKNAAAIAAEKAKAEGGAS